MSNATTKVAVSLPAELFRAVERVRKASGRSRSAIVQDALRRWLKSQAEALLVREYEAGYRKRPETRREIQAAAAAAVRLLSSEEW